MIHVAKQMAFHVFTVAVVCFVTVGDGVTAGVSFGSIVALGVAVGLGVGLGDGVGEGVGSAIMVCAAVSSFGGLHLEHGV